MVDDLFDHLAAIWPQVLSSSGPAAVAWRLLRSALAGRARCCCAAPAGPAHHALPPIQADSLVLHHLLGLEPQEAADLMGVRPSVMQGLITSAERAAPDCLLAHLNQNGTQRTAACGAAGSVAHHDRAPL
ncbi:hypothetical protein ACIP79_40935 [Streptomyces sp. NPDC088747]|uniref:hypothetical protein n=1 Tax=Streptomyces sp. NPDC088747 TaxID=3365886 RepID=UPI00380947FC